MTLKYLQSYNPKKYPRPEPNDRVAIHRFIQKGDDKKILYEIDHGKIRPSKSLQNAISNMLKGNREFIMIDDQKVVYENILQLACKSKADMKKRTIIVEGGPGTGKSVVAINLLAELTKRGQFAQYASKNSAPRQVYSQKLKGNFKKSRVDIMFRSTGSYTEIENNYVDTIRFLLNPKSPFKLKDNRLAFFPFI